MKKTPKKKTPPKKKPTPKREFGITLDEVIRRHREALRKPSKR